MPRKKDVPRKNTRPKDENPFFESLLLARAVFKFALYTLAQGNPVPKKKIYTFQKNSPNLDPFQFLEKFFCGFLYFWDFGFSVFQNPYKDKKTRE